MGKGLGVYVESISYPGRSVNDLRQIVQEFKDKSCHGALHQGRF